MKKFLLFTALLFAVVVSAQDSINESQKLKDLITTAKTKPNEKAKAIVDIMVLGAISKNEKIKKSADSVVAVLNNYAAIDKIAKDNNIVLAKKQSDLSKEDLKEYRIEDDKFRSITFYTPKVSGTSKYAYLSVKENSMKYHLVMEHHGAGWIFFDKVIILYNGKKLEYKSGETKRYVGNGYVNETSDVVCDIEMLEALREIINTDKVDVRLSGDSVNDFVMSDKTKKSIRLALELFDKLKK